MLERRGEKSNNYLNILMDASPNIIIISDGQRLFAANKAMLQFVNYPNIEAFLQDHEDISDFFEACNEQALLKTMEEFSWLEHTLAHPSENLVYMQKEGHLHIFKVQSQKLLLSDKIFYTSIFNDVTEIETQKERYEQAIEGSQLGLWDWDLQTDSIYFSPYWKKMLGYQDHELPNCFASWQERVHPDDLSYALQAIKDNIEGREPFYQCTHRLRHKDGHWVWIDDRGKTYFNKEGTPTRMIGIHNDITRIKDSEAKNIFYAKRSEAMLKLPKLNENFDEADFMQHALEIIEDLTQSCISFIHFINDDEQTIELVTWSRRTLKEYCHAVSDTHYPISHAGIWANALHERQAIIINDYAQALHKKGLPDNHAPLHSFISVPVIENGKVVMLCGVGNKEEAYDDQDIETTQLIASETWRLVQLKRNALALKETQAMLLVQSRYAAMGEMISMIAHQWRQPISVISMCVNNMLLDIELGDIEQKELEKQLHDILAQTEHLSLTIDDFRNFFKPNKEKELACVQDVLEDALSLVKKSFDNNDILITLNGESHTKIKLYKRELIQVFLNILKNAKEAVELHEDINSAIDITLYETQNTVVTRICDNGGGIKEEDLLRIFEPYFSTKGEKNGTGIGLYISKIIIEKHLLGELKAHNHEEGACFEIILPK